MKSITIDYKHFEKAGFDSKNCSVADVEIPNGRHATRVKVYDTATAAPLFQNQTNVGDIVTFAVEFLPFVRGKELVSRADDLIQDVFKDGYEPAPCTICTYKKDGSIDTKKTINDVFIQQVKLFVNKKDEATGEMGYIRILFTLQGLRTKK